MIMTEQAEVQQGRTQGQDVRKRVIKDEKTGHAEGMREKR